MLNNSFNKLNSLFKSNKHVDFYYVNSYHLNLNEINKLEHPLSPNKINFENLSKFSNYPHSREMDFLNLLIQKNHTNLCLACSCVFKRRIWMENLEVIDKNKVSELNPFSNLQNTATQSIIWARGFKNKKAYFLSDPVSANIHGPRNSDWGNYYPFIEGIRIPPTS